MMLTLSIVTALIGSVVAPPAHAVLPSTPESPAVMCHGEFGDERFEISVRTLGHADLDLNSGTMAADVIGFQKESADPRGHLHTLTAGHEVWTVVTASGRTYQFGFAHGASKSKPYEFFGLAASPWTGDIAVLRLSCPRSVTSEAKS